jgi:hypothetical protein
LEQDQHVENDRGFTRLHNSFRSLIDLIKIDFHFTRNYE